MVNEHQGKVYEPTPVYTRKYLRNIIRETVIAHDGYHNVSEKVNGGFKIIREKMTQE